jgi:hypothetical protein
MGGVVTYVEAEEFFEVATGADGWREFLVGPCLRSTIVSQNMNIRIYSLGSCMYSGPPSSASNVRNPVNNERNNAHLDLPQIIPKQ